MNSSEKFKLFEGCKVRSLREGCAIPMHYEFFTCKRNVVRGLEEQLMAASYENPDKYDYINKRYVYEITNVDGGIIYVKFESGKATFGSQILA